MYASLNGQSNPESGICTAEAAQLHLYNFQSLVYSYVNLQSCV